jgi:transcriptional regulator with XRE-family HTH domain
MLRLTQERLGEALDLTFQQVQKYERGTNRVSASRLYRLSRVLDVPIWFFFDNTDPVRAPPVPADPDDDMPSFPNDPLSQEETNELLDAFEAIGDSLVRRRLAELLGALSEDKTSSPVRRQRRMRI